jgi:hypothetical protein
LDQSLLLGRFVLQMKAFVVPTTTQITQGFYLNSSLLFAENFENKQFFVHSSRSVVLVNRKNRPKPITKKTQSKLSGGIVSRTSVKTLISSFLSSRPLLTAQKNKNVTRKNTTLKKGTSFFMQKKYQKKLISFPLQDKLNAYERACFLKRKRRKIVRLYERTGFLNSTFFYKTRTYKAFHDELTASKPSLFYSLKSLTNSLSGPAV